MFCRKCGAQIPDMSKFCSTCGAPAIKVPTPETIVNEPINNDVFKNELFNAESFVGEPAFNEPIFGEPEMSEPAINEPVFSESAVSEPAFVEPLVSGQSSNEPIFNDSAAEMFNEGVPENPAESSFKTYDDNLKFGIEPQQDLGISPVFTDAPQPQSQYQVQYQPQSKPQRAKTEPWFGFGLTGLIFIIIAFFMPMLSSNSYGRYEIGPSPFDIIKMGGGEDTWTLYALAGVIVLAVIVFFVYSILEIIPGIIGIGLWVYIFIKLIKYTSSENDIGSILESLSGGFYLSFIGCVLLIICGSFSFKKLKNK